MSQPPTGPPPPGGAPPPQWTPPPPPPRRRKPRVLWFFVAGAMVVAAPLIFVGALFTVLRPLTQEDAVFSTADGQVQVDLPAGEERAVFTDGAGPVQCSASDGSGTGLPMRGVTGDFSYNEWTAVHRFDTGDGEVSIECSGFSGQERFRIAQLPSTGGFVAGIVIGIIGPLLLGGGGLVLLIVITILYATGAPRDPKRPSST